MNTKMNIKSLISFIFTVVCAVFLLWVVLSILNTVSHNGSVEAAKNIWSWNFFKVFFG